MYTTLVTKEQKYDNEVILWKLANLNLFNEKDRSKCDHSELAIELRWDLINAGVVAKGFCLHGSLCIVGHLPLDTSTKCAQVRLSQTGHKICVCVPVLLIHNAEK